MACVTVPSAFTTYCAPFPKAVVEDVMPGPRAVLLCEAGMYVVVRPGAGDVTVPGIALPEVLAVPDELPVVAAVVPVDTERALPPDAAVVPEAVVGDENAWTAGAARADGSTANAAEKPEIR